MNHTRGQFIAIWVIFGVTVFFAMQQYAMLLKELLVSAGIYFDIIPSVLKYAPAFSYGIIWIILVALLTNIIRRKTPEAEAVNYKSIRYSLLIFLFTGVLSQVAIEFLQKARWSVLKEYLDRHNASMVEYLNQSVMIKLVPIALILITILIAFFILTREDE